MPSRAKFQQALLDVAALSEGVPDGVLRFEVPIRSLRVQGEVVMGDWKVEVKEAGLSGQGMTGEDALEGLVLSLLPRSLTP